MPTTRVSCEIAVPKEAAFALVADIQQYRKAVTYITDVEYHSEQTSGVGTRYTETRVMNGREASSVFEITEFEPPNRLRIVTDAGGTVWDSVFEFKENGGGTTLEVAMEARAYRFFARIINFLIKGLIRKEMVKELDLAKEYLERTTK